MKIIGIDPGKNGAIAVIDTERDPIAHTYPMPETEADLHGLMLMLRDSGFRHGIIEKVGAMPGNAARSMFTFGRGYGAVRMAMIACRIVFDEVQPGKWQQALGIPKREKTQSKVEHKNKLKAKAQQLFPSVKITLGNADALLIAEYARRNSHILFTTPSHETVVA